MILSYCNIPFIQNGFLTLPTNQDGLHYLSIFPWFRDKLQLQSHPHSSSQSFQHSKTGIPGSVLYPADICLRDSSALRQLLPCFNIYYLVRFLSLFVKKRALNKAIPISLSLYAVNSFLCFLL